MRGDAISEHPQKRSLGGKFEVNFRTDPTVYDGRFGNNGWLQELPKPITKLTWDNAAIMSPGDAHRLGVESADKVRLTYEGHTLKAPVWIQPGHVDGSITVHLGYGRTAGGRSAIGMGFNPYGLRTGKALWTDTGLDAVKIDEKYLFAVTHAERRRHSQRASTGTRTPHHPRRHAGRVPEGTGIGAPRRGSSAARAHHVSRLELQDRRKRQTEIRLGHGNRSQRLHRLQRLRGGVPGGKQHRGGR
ncbi:MAG: hypothetical protein WDO73_27190 [Ignavibacteriota bacterium]